MSCSDVHQPAAPPNITTIIMKDSIAIHPDSDAPIHLLSAPNSPTSSNSIMNATAISDTCGSAWFSISTTSYPDGYDLVTCGMTVVNAITSAIMTLKFFFPVPNMFVFCSTANTIVNINKKGISASVKP